jgi:predicted phosphodiesterase
MESKIFMSEAGPGCEKNTHSRIGIMADSHGQPDKIVAALEFFSERGCRRLFHLGDICDSGHPETAEACVRPLQEYGVMAIKGNNDHQIDVNYTGQPQSLIPCDILDFIRNLPLVRHCQHSVFTHSLPFDRELGLSSMIGMMGKVEMNRFFSTDPQGILFRGHSHKPEVFRKQDKKIISRTLRIGQRFNLSNRLPCVVICGALTRELCLIWEPFENTIECHRIG